MGYNLVYIIVEISSKKKILEILFIYLELRLVLLLLLLSFRLLILFL